MSSITGESGIQRAPAPPVAPKIPQPKLDVETQPEAAPANDRAAWQAERARRLKNGYDWPIVFWIGLLHVGALAAPFTFTWQGLVTMLALHWITGGLGICLGFHRLFTHSSFATYKPVRWFIAWLGGLAGEGSVVHWVANHRKHHALSDQVGDPHSPLDGPWWSHIFWTMCSFESKEFEAHNRKWAPDIVKDPFMRFLDRTFILWHVAFSVAIFAVGYWLGGARLAWSLLVWGVFLRLTLVLHTTWLVNSASHMWGYRNYVTRDKSRNLWWVALVTYGEGWHNNHHAYPRMARHGHKWWEIDFTYYAIRVLKGVGLAWDVVEDQHKKSAD